MATNSENKPNPPAKQEAGGSAGEKYFIKPKFNKYPRLMATLGSERINLLGKDVESEVTIPGTDDKKTVKHRGATQDDLAFLMDKDYPGDYSNIIGVRAGK